MLTKVITRIAEYAFTKELDKYNWQTIYENSRNDILSALEKQDDDRGKLPKLLKIKELKNTFAL